MKLYNLFPWHLQYIMPYINNIDVNYQTEIKTLGSHKTNLQYEYNNIIQQFIEPDNMALAYLGTKIQELTEDNIIQSLDIKSQSIKWLDQYTDSHKHNKNQTNIEDILPNIQNLYDETKYDTNEGLRLDQYTDSHKHNKNQTNIEDILPNIQNLYDETKYDTNEGITDNLIPSTKPTLTNDHSEYTTQIIDNIRINFNQLDQQFYDLINEYLSIEQIQKINLYPYIQQIPLVGDKLASIVGTINEKIIRYIDKKYNLDNIIPPVYRTSIKNIVAYAVLQNTLLKAQQLHTIQINNGIDYNLITKMISKLLPRRYILNPNKLIKSTADNQQLIEFKTDILTDNINYMISEISDIIVKSIDDGSYDEIENILYAKELERSKITYDLNDDPILSYYFPVPNYVLPYFTYDTKEYITHFTEDNLHSSIYVPYKILSQIYDMISLSISDANLLETENTNKNIDTISNILDEKYIPSNILSKSTEEVNIVNKFKER